MYAAKAYKQYQQTQITSSNQQTLIIMLYAGAIKFISMARRNIQKGDPAAKGMAISRSIDIINELSNSLNYEMGGEIAKQLGDIYLHINHMLTKANMTNQVQPLDHSIEILHTLKEAWENIPAKRIQRERELQTASV